MTTELGLNARNSAEEVASLEEEPATILLQRLEGKTVKESLWNLGVVIFNHVQVRLINYRIYYSFRYLRT